MPDEIQWTQCPTCGTVHGRDVPVTNPIPKPVPLYGGPMDGREAADPAFIAAVFRGGIAMGDGVYQLGAGPKGGPCYVWRESKHAR